MLFLCVSHSRTSRPTDEKKSLTASPKSAAKPLYGGASSQWANAPSSAASTQTIVSTTVKEPSPNSPQMQPRPTAAQVARAQSGGSPGSPMRRAFAPPVKATFSAFPLIGWVTHPFLFVPDFCTAHNATGLVCSGSSAAALCLAPHCTSKPDHARCIATVHCLVTARGHACAVRKSTATNHPLCAVFCLKTLHNVV